MCIRDSSSNSRSSTPTITTDGAANTIATAATTKLSQDRPGTPCKYIPTIFRVRRWNCTKWPYNETYLAKPSSGTISFTVFYKLAFWMLFHLFPISFMFPVLKRFFELSGFLQQNQRSAQQVQVNKVPQAKREVQQAKNLVYPRHLPLEGQEETQEQAPQHRPVVRKALRESLRKAWEGT